MTGTATLPLQLNVLHSALVELCIEETLKTTQWRIVMTCMPTLPLQLNLLQSTMAELCMTIHLKRHSG